MARRAAYLSSLGLSLGALGAEHSAETAVALAAALAEDDVCGVHAGTATCALELAQLRSFWMVPRRRSQEHKLEDDGDPFSDAFGTRLAVDGEVPGGSLPTQQLHHDIKKDHTHHKTATNEPPHAKLAEKHKGRAAHVGKPAVFRDALGDEVPLSVPGGEVALFDRARTQGPDNFEKRMEEQAEKDREKWAQQDANGRAAKVNCGGDEFVKSCDLCPRGHGAKWCHGECMWMDGACIERSVSCGGEKRVKTCAQCPRGHYKHWCNGDCEWRNETATCMDPFGGVGEPPSLREAREAAEAEAALRARDAARTATTTTTTMASTTQVLPGWSTLHKNWNCAGTANVNDHDSSNSDLTSNEACAEGCFGDGHRIAAFWPNQNLCRCYDDCSDGGPTRAEWPNLVMQKSEVMSHGLGF